MFAGHEASANTLHFIIILLACNPEIQASLQADIDRITHSKARESWAYEENYQPLLESLVGAVINETLRLFTVLPYILKSTTKVPQSLSVHNRTHIVPPNTLMLINTTAAHRNPKYWPNPAKYCHTDTRPNPLDRFDPKQWLERDKGKDGGLFKPASGSFIPFSDGSRGCLGQHFSMIELCAAVTTIFAQHSVELVVPPYGKIVDMESRRAAWQSARREAEIALTDGVTFEMSLRMATKVPIRFIARKKGALPEL